MTREQEIIKFIQENTDYTIEEIKKALRRKYPEMKFYNEDIEEYIAKANEREKDGDFER